MILLSTETCILVFQSQSHRSSSGRQISSPVGELQQTHPALGQHIPSGAHIGPSQSCLTIVLGAAMAINFLAFSVFLQSSSLAAQYSPTAQHKNPAMGQHPSRQIVPSQYWLASFSSDSITFLKGLAASRISY